MWTAGDPIDPDLIDLPVEEELTCEEKAEALDCSTGFYNYLECIVHGAHEPETACIDAPIPAGFGGAPALGVAGEGGMGGQGGDVSAPLHPAACPGYLGGACTYISCIESARRFPDGSIECCYGRAYWLCP